MCNKAIVRKTLDPTKFKAKCIAGEIMVVYPDDNPRETPICLKIVGAMTQENCVEANRLVANPQEVIDYLNRGEVDYETHIRYRLKA